jgi:hypothetical protein
MDMSLLKVIPITPAYRENYGAVDWSSPERIVYGAETVGGQREISVETLKRMAESVGE